MNSPEHTAGPWRVTQEPNCPDGPHGFGIETADDDQWTVADVNSDLPTSAETFANARLIAAAPQLLEALEAILADCGHSDYDDGRIVATAAIVKAEAAIRSAKGETL